MSLYNIELEKSIISSLLNVENTFDTIGDRLTKQSFYAGRHQVLFELISGLFKAGQPYDTLTVDAEVKARNLEEQTGGEAYLSELLNVPNSVFNLSHYADRLLDLQQRREINQRLLEAQGLIADMDVKPIDAWSITAEGVNKAVEGQEGESFCEIGDLTEQFLEDLREAAKSGVKPGIKTGLIEFDNRVTIDKGQMCIIAARPSMGKTTLAQNILKSVADKEDGKAVFFSLEMPKLDIYRRLASSEASIEMDKVFGGQGLDGDDWDKIMLNISALQDTNMIVDDRPRLSVGQIRATLNKIRQKYGRVSCVMVDYIGLVKANDQSKDKVHQVEQVSADLKGMAKEFDCPFIVLSQLNRGLEKRPDKRPTMSDLRDSGAIEQDADQIILIYRDEVYNENTDQKGIAELIVNKQRNGAKGTIRVGFEGKYSRFTNLAHRVDDDFAYGAQQ